MKEWVAQKVGQLEKQAEEDSVLVEKSFTQANQIKDELRDCREKLAKAEAPD